MYVWPFTYSLFSPRSRLVLFFAVCLRTVRQPVYAVQSMHHGLIAHSHISCVVAVQDLDSGVEEGASSSGARNELEAEVIAAVAAVLGRSPESISIHSNFFDLGGHSLSATRLVTRLNKAMQVSSVVQGFSLLCPPPSSDMLTICIFRSISPFSCLHLWHRVRSFCGPRWRLLKSFPLAHILPQIRIPVSRLFENPTIAGIASVVTSLTSRRGGRKGSDTTSQVTMRELASLRRSKQQKAVQSGSAADSFVYAASYGQRSMYLASSANEAEGRQPAVFGKRVCLAFPS